MDISIKPGELGGLANILYGKGAAASDDQNTPPPDAQSAPSGPVAANTQNPIPSNQGFYDLVRGQPSTPPEQVQTPPQQAQTPPATNAASAPVAVSTPQGQGAAVKLFTDPNALLLMGAALGSRSRDETLLQSASRGLLAGMQYINAKDRQAVIDAAEQQKAAQSAAESAARITESGARVKGQNVQTAGMEQEQQFKAQGQPTALAAAKARLQQLQEQARAEPDRTKALQLENQAKNYENQLRQQYGEQAMQADIGYKEAQTSQAKASAAKSLTESELAAAKWKIIQAMPPEEQKTFLMSGGLSGKYKTEQDKVDEFLRTRGKDFMDLDGNFNVKAFREAYQGTRVENMAKGGTPPTQAQAHAEARAVIAKGADKAKVNERLKAKGYDPID